MERQTVGFIIYRDTEDTMVPVSEQGQVLLFDTPEAARRTKPGALDIIVPVSPRGLAIAQRRLEP